MKKRTVITTEMREVWIVSLSSGDADVLEVASETVKSSDSPATVSEHRSEIGISPDDHQQQSDEGQKK